MDVREGMRGRRGETRPALREAEPLEPTSKPPFLVTALAPNPLLTLFSICSLRVFPRKRPGGLTQGARVRGCIPEHQIAVLSHGAGSV